MDGGQYVALGAFLIVGFTVGTLFLLFERTYILTCELEMEKRSERGLRRPRRTTLAHRGGGSQRMLVVGWSSRDAQGNVRGGREPAERNRRMSDANFRRD